MFCLKAFRKFDVFNQNVLDVTIEIENWIYKHSKLKIEIH